MILIKRSFDFLKRSFHFVKRSFGFLKRSFDFLKRSFDFKSSKGLSPNHQRSVPESSEVCPQIIRGLSPKQ
ncbi:MAG: hypothetical protein LBQ77_00530 [Treponema sp.]|nr:hypothetical protein [Treponema sp.]